VTKSSNPGPRLTCPNCEPRSAVYFVPYSIRKLALPDIVFVDLDEPALANPTIMTYRASDAFETQLRLRFFRLGIRHLATPLN
jgi:hypothetical protein